MRSLHVSLLALVGAAALAGLGTVRIGSVGIPALGGAWVAALAALVLMHAARRSSSTRLPFRRFLLLGALLAASGWRFDSWWSDMQAPLSPLVAHIRATDDEPMRTVAPIRSLKLPERRLLARLTGRRRHFTLDVEGFLFVPRPGTYRLAMSCDDGCELRLDGGPLLAGAGALARAVELEPGVRRLELHYQQNAGPAYLVLAWQTPAALSLLPIEAHLAGDAGAFEEASLRFSAWTSWVLLSLGLSWLATASFVAVRAAESAPGWAHAVQKWWRRPPPSKPTLLVRPLAWLGAGALFLGLAVTARATLPSRLEALSQEYIVNPRRAPFVLGRVEAFPEYLFFLGALAILVAVALRRLPSASPGRSSRRWTGWLLAAIAAALLAGGLVSEDEWIRYGRPCYDGYCEYADYVRAVMLAPGPDAWSALGDHLGRNYHANSPVGPVLIAATSLLGPSTVASYRIVSGFGTLGTLLLLLVVARRDLQLGWTPALVAGFLFTATGAVQRSFLFPQTDALAMFFFTLAVERLLAVRRRVSVGRGLFASVSVALALLTKLSALPLAAIAVLLVAWPRSEEPLTLRRLLPGVLRAALVVLPPVLLVLAYVVALRTSNNVRTELFRIETLDSRPSFHLVATLVTLLPFFVALALTVKRRWTRTEVLLALSVGVYLLGLWASGASGWERFYLNAVPLALPLAVARLEPLPELRAPPDVALIAAAYAVAQLVRMLLHLYNGA